MPRSSRHRSHRSHKHLRDRSDSEDDVNTGDRRNKEEEPAGNSGARVSRDPESGKRKFSNENARKDLVGTSDGDVSGEHGKKRKDRVEEVVADERWNGGADNDLKRAKSDDSSPELDKCSKPKFLTVDIKERSAKRHEDSNEREEDSGGKIDSIKLKSEKDSSRRESHSQYNDEKARDRMERDSNKDKDGRDSRYDKSDDLQSRKHGSKSGSSAEALTSKKYTKINEKKGHDIFHSPEAEKGFEKPRKNRDDVEDKDKWLDDFREVDDRKQSSRDDHIKYRSYKDEKHEDSKNRGKYRDDKKHQVDKYQEERFSKDHNSDRSEKWYLKDETKPVESNYRKTILQDADHDGTYADNMDTKIKDIRGRKRSSDEIEDHNDLKARIVKERREVLEKNASSASRNGSRNDKPRPDNLHSERTDSSPRNHRLKSSISSGGKDHNRDISKLSEYAHRDSATEERLSSIPASKGDSFNSSVVNDRISGSRSGKIATTENIHSGDLFAETTASKYDRTLRSDARTSPNQSRRRSPSANSGRRFSERSPSRFDRTSRQRLDVEVGQRNSLSKDGERREFWGQPITDDISQTDVCLRESTPVRSSSINRCSNLSDYSRNHLLPPPSMRVGIDNPSVLGPYQDDNRAQSTDHKSYNRHKRVGDLGYGRGHGNAWKGAPPSWPSPVPNGFPSLQHGPAGFHPAMSQFSAPHFFGVRPPMDLIHGGVSYHMHDEVERFTGHGRPFGWHNPVDHSHLQMWDGSNGIYTNEPQMYGRPEWDDSSQLGSRVWEISSETWKGQNSNNMDIPVSKKEQESSTNSLTNIIAQSKNLATENIEAKQSSDVLHPKRTVESPEKVVTKKTTEHLEMAVDQLTKYVAHYLSKIDISSDLLNPDLHKRCTSVSGKLDAKCSLTAPGFIQTDKDGMKDPSSMKNSLPTPKADIFKRAMSLYSGKRSEKLTGKQVSMNLDGPTNGQPTGFAPDFVISTSSSQHFEALTEECSETSQPREVLTEECSETVTRIPAN
ncbi:hypothetical protein Cni_G10201 [Canna indica]|uniref:Zinc finger CCCH domain-containing protein 13-like n=1 Tax=Canna indica TaxID=4628 RepID=A0AAQ3QAF5_9LILI|nr:hypothetical protein Cni_G10201 [Canna indica]